MFRRGPAEFFLFHSFRGPVASPVATPALRSSGRLPNSQGIWLIFHHSPPRFLRAQVSDARRSFAFQRARPAESPAWRSARNCFSAPRAAGGIKAALDPPGRAPARSCPNSARFVTAFCLRPVVGSGAHFRLRRGILRKSNRGNPSGRLVRNRPFCPLPNAPFLTAPLRRAASYGAKGARCAERTRSPRPATSCARPFASSARRRSVADLPRSGANSRFSA